MTQHKMIQWLNHCDVSLFRGFDPLRTNLWIVQGSRLISHSGDGPPYLVIPLLLQFTHYPLQPDLYRLLAIAFLIERALYFSMKLSFRRNRPADAIDHFEAAIKPSDQFSFPSGHSSAAFLFASFLACVMPDFSSLFLLWAALVSLSRLLLGVHFVTDILVGAAIGLLTAQLTFGGL